MRRSLILCALLCLAAAPSVLFNTLPLVHAQTDEELQAEIERSQAQIQQLRDEIAQLQTQLNTTAEQKQTLQTAIKGLDLQIQKLQKSISLTQAQINNKDKEIKTLSNNITNASEQIDRSQDGVAQALRQLQELDNESAMVMLFSGSTLSAFFDNTVTLSSVRSELQNRVYTLSDLKEDLETNKSVAEVKRSELSRLQKNLGEQRQGLSISRENQNTLLKETKNKESTYQAQIAEKKRQEEEFEAQLRKYEAQLGLTVEAGTFASARAGVLQWPVAQPYITQYFGNTPFATANPQIYGSRGHNAIDLRAVDGTPILAALGGRVQAIGNTDLQKGCYSYGKWVLVKHENGLSTLYAHLSRIDVGVGQSVSTGETLGYSGRTGYATGPHLHFGVFASAGVKVERFTKSVNCKLVDVPLVDPTAYLNPLSYLPTL